MNQIPQKKITEQPKQWNDMDGASSTERPRYPQAGLVRPKSQEDDISTNDEWISTTSSDTVPSDGDDASSDYEKDVGDNDGNSKKPPLRMLCKR